MIKFKLGSITGRVTSALLVNQYHYPPQKKNISGNKNCYIKSLTSNRRYSVGLSLSCLVAVPKNDVIYETTGSQGQSNIIRNVTTMPSCRCKNAKFFPHFVAHGQC